MIGKPFRGLWQRWVNRRIPRADEYRLGRHNIFVLPTREGMLFTGLLLISLLTGINYQNSLIYLFTFILGTMFYGTIFQTYRNLENLHVTVLSLGDCVAGQSLPVRLRLAAGDDSTRPALRLALPEQTPLETVVEGHHSDPITLPLETRRRGSVTSPAIRIETDFPFGLIRAWTWVRPQRTGVATPRPVEPPAQPAGGESDEGDQAITRTAQGDTDTLLRPYRTGDSLKRVNWKLFARSGDMVVADWDTPTGDPQWLDWNQYPGVDTELRLSYLAWRVESNFQQQQPWGLRLPGRVLEPDYGAAHREASLRALGLHGEAGEAVS